MFEKIPIDRRATYTLLNSDDYHFDNRLVFLLDLPERGVLHKEIRKYAAKLHEFKERPICALWHSITRH